VTEKAILKKLSHFVTVDCKGFPGFIAAIFIKCDSDLDSPEKCRQCPKKGPVAGFF
jgi:hypothetical protein